MKAVYPASNIDLLKEKSITKPNQVWFADITCVRVEGGFGYCVAFIDAYSRKVMFMRVSNTLSADFCIEAAIHTDKGKRFVGGEFTNLLKDFGIKPSVSEESFRGNIPSGIGGMGRQMRCIMDKSNVLWHELKEAFGGLKIGCYFKLVNYFFDAIKSV